MESQADRLSCAVLFSGSGSTANALLKYSLQSDCRYKIELLVTNNPKAAGIKLAADYGVEILILPDQRNNKPIDRAEWGKLLHQRLVAHRLELIILAGFMRILDGYLISSWSGKIINIHPSLLPRYKGLDTYLRVLAAGDAWHGFSIHMVIAELDSGKLLAQYKVAVAVGETAQSLQQKVQLEERRWYPQIIDLIASGRVRLDTLQPLFDNQPLSPTGLELCDTFFW